MELKPISDALNDTPIERYKQLYRDAMYKEWYFDTLLQKLFITGCFFYTLISIGIKLWNLIM